jgi:hypothetical protein
MNRKGHSKNADILPVMDSSRAHYLGAIRFTPSVAGIVLSMKQKTVKANGESTYDIKKSLAVLREPFEKFTDRCRKLHYDGADLAEHLKGVDPDAIPEKVQVMLAEEKKDKTTVKLEMELPLWMYGRLCEAAVIHECSDWREALLLYLQCTLVEWENDRGYYLDL